MPIPLIAANVGAAALKSLQNRRGPAGSGNLPSNLKLPSFQEMMSAMQQGDINLKDLMSLNGPALQAKLKSLTPEQQQALARQLVGANVTMSSSNGGSASGTISSLSQIGGTPALNMAGMPYSLGQIEAINHLSA